MLKDLIKKLKAQRLEPKEEIKLSSVLDTIKDALTKNMAMLNKYYASESGGGQINLTELVNVFKPLSNNLCGNLDKPFINNFGRISENYVPYGVVGVSIDKTLSIIQLAEILNVFIQTKNSLVVQANFKSKTFELLIAVVNDVLSQTKDFTEIELVDNSEILSNCDDFDLLVYIGDKNKFEAVNTTVQKKYFGIGNYELFVHEEMDKNLIQEAHKRNIVVYHADTNIKAINNSGNNYCTAIMSSNKNKIREFISEIKSTFILVNMLPTLETRINIFPTDLLQRKSVAVYDK